MNNNSKKDNSFFNLICLRDYFPVKINERSMHHKFIGNDGNAHDIQYTCEKIIIIAGIIYRIKI